MQGLDQGGGCDDGKKPVVSDRVHTAVTDRSGGVFAWFLGASCLGLAILVVLLARQNRSLRAQLDAALSNLSPAGANAAGPAKPRGGELHIGDQLEPLATFGSPLGDALRFSGGSAATLLFVFGGDCEACEGMDEGGTTRRCPESRRLNDQEWRVGEAQIASILTPPCP